MKTSKVTGIVLRTFPYGETHKIVTLYTKEQGKIAVVAHGAKKTKGKLAGVTQLFTKGVYLVTNSRRGMGTLNQGETIQRYKNIQSDLFRLTYASSVAELLDRLTEENEADENLYEILEQSLQFINEGYDARIIATMAQTKLLPYAGIQIQFNGCVCCGSQRGNFRFSVKEGGVICQECFSKDPYAIPVSPAAIRILRLMYYMNMKRLGTINVRENTKEEMETILFHLYEEYAGITLKSHKFMKDMQRFQQTLSS
jgi:DNA repair protein RecO (recombination protein O)